MEKESFFKTLSDSKLKSLNAKNLLAYYKAERKRYYKKLSSYICDCCGSFYWEINNREHAFEEIEFENWKKYLEHIKTFLAKKEHVSAQLDRSKPRTTYYRRKICS